MSSPTTTGQVAVVTGLDAIVGATHVLTGDAITPELTTDEALGSVPVRPLAVVLPGSAGEVASIVALVPGDRHAGRRSWRGHRPVRRMPPESRRDRALVRQDEPDPRGGRAEPCRRRATGGDAPAAGRGALRSRARLPGPSGRAERDDRGQRRDQRRRHAGGAPRRDPPARARPRGRARHRGDRSGPAARSQSPRAATTSAS